MPTPALPVILDTDLAMGVPGSDIDDGFALALALADPGLDLVAVTCVGGNADVESAVLLAKELLELLDRRHVPVHRGAAAPLCHPELRRGAPEQIRAAFGRHEADPGPAAARIAELVAERPELRHVVLMCPAVNFIDASALESLEEINRRLEDPALYQSQPREAHALSERLAAIDDELMLLLERWETLE